MPSAVARRTLGALAVLGACAGMLCIAVAGAQADPVLTITSPADGGFSNNPSPTVSFTGAASGDTVTLTSSNNGAADGQATADINGAGSITPTSPVASGPNDRETLTATETTAAPTRWL